MVDLPCSVSDYSVTVSTVDLPCSVSDNSVTVSTVELPCSVSNYSVSTVVVLTYPVVCQTTVLVLL